MGFSFQKHTVSVEIEGKDYVIDLGDAEVFDNIASWGERIQNEDYADATEGQAQALSADVKGYLKILLGQEQFEDIFESRPWSMLDGLELFAYLYSKIAEAQIGDRFDEAIARYVPDMPEA